MEFRFKFYQINFLSQTCILPNSFTRIRHRFHEQYRGNETTSQRIATNLFRAKRNSCSVTSIRLVRELGSVVDIDSDCAGIGCGGADFCVVIVCGESAVNQHNL